MKQDNDYGARLHWLAFNWKTGLALILLFGVPRFWLVMLANMQQSYSSVSIIFMLMILFPFIFLTKSGRSRIGIHAPSNRRMMGVALISGFVLSLMLGGLGSMLYDQDISNWFYYISRSYRLPAEALTENRLMYFLIFAVISMLFSPLGEEFLYRGWIHACFVPRFGETGASRIDSLAFAGTHLAHFGLVFSGGSWQWLVVPSLIWLGLMYVCARFFHFCKVWTGSIFGAVIGHAGLNFGMTWYIFYVVL